ncbi:MAG: signal peptidase I [Clostridia bacterium]|nr:signal peptidase I [Clostridia bacterium]
MESKGKSILGVITDILLIIIIIIAIIITVMTFTSKNSDLGIGNILGYTPFSVQSDSMAPTFTSGDLIIAKEVKDVTTLKKGDVITYASVITDSNGRSMASYNTHRISDIQYNTDGTIQFFVTKGDAMGTEDSVVVLPDEVIAKQVNSGIDANGNQLEGLKIANFGSALNFLQSRTGFMICIIVPLALFFIWQIYKLIAMFMEAKAANLSEESKRQAVEEYLAQQNNGEIPSGSDKPEE